MPTTSRFRIGEVSPKDIPFKRLGKNCRIEEGVRFYHPENIEIGNNVYIGPECWLNAGLDGHILIGDGSWIGPYCFLHGVGGIVIGRRVGIGPHVKFISDQHLAADPDVPVIDTPCARKRIAVGDGSDVGTNSVIILGVSIGKHVIIGCNAAVIRDIPDYTMAAGVPCRVRKYRKAAQGPCT